MAHLKGILPTTNAGDIPIETLGEGMIHSSHPLYEEDLDTLYTVYASLHESPAYGCPSFWFGISSQLMPRLIGVNPVEEDKQTDEAVLEDATLRRVSLGIGEIQVDNTGLARYSLARPMREAGLFVIIPDGYN